MHGQLHGNGHAHGNARVGRTGRLGDVGSLARGGRESREPRRAELAAFLRARRERLRPEEVGLPSTGGRRRTPGLRREEVAQLAGVGVTWYTWLEQGREINPSASVLSAICGALRLDPFEREHVFTLAGVPDDLPAARLPVEVDPVTERVLATLDPYPAMIVGACHSIRAYNDAIIRLFGDISVLPPERRNSMWLCFVEPTWRTFVVDWEAEVPHSVAMFRGAMAEHVGEPLWEQLVAELCELSEEFRTLWSDRRVAMPGPRVKRFRHAEVGLVELESRSFWLAPRTGARLITYVPTTVESKTALERLRMSERPPFSGWAEVVHHGTRALTARRRA